MSLDDLIVQYDGKYVEVAGTTEAKNQCVDLANLYIRDVLKLPIVEWTNAIDFPSRVNPNDFEYIPNTPTGVPQKGDLVIWKPSPGHIAIFIDGDTKGFRSFDQNFPLYSVCHIQNHDYTNVIGWLHPKVLPVDTVAVPKKDFEALVTKSSKYDDLVGAGFTSVQVVNNKLDELNSHIISLQERIRLLEQNDVIQEGTIKAQKAELDVLTAKLSTCESELSSRPIVEPLKQFYFFGHKVWVF